MKEHLKKHAFTKGDPRASAAGKKSKRGRNLATIIKDVVREGKIDGEQFIMSLYHQAFEGNSAIAKLLVEYESGKVAERMELTGADGEPIQQVNKIEVEFVKPKNKTSRKAK